MKRSARIISGTDERATQRQYRRARAHGNAAGPIARPAFIAADQLSLDWIGTALAFGC
jgi:hypothetical protein